VLGRVREAWAASGDYSSGAWDPPFSPWCKRRWKYTKLEKGITAYELSRGRREPRLHHPAKIIHEEWKKAELQSLRMRKTASRVGARGGWRVSVDSRLKAQKETTDCLQEASGATEKTVKKQFHQQIMEESALKGRNLSNR